MTKRNLNKQNSLLIGYEVSTGKPVRISLETVDRHLAYFGKSGSGKSVGTKFHFFSLANHRSVGLIDPNSHLADDILDHIAVSPALRKRCLYISATSKKVAPIIDFMQQSDLEVSRNIKRRKNLAAFFAKALIMTASPGGSNAGISFTRLKMNVEMGVRLLLELKLPMAFLPHLFQFQSKLLRCLMERTVDLDVMAHFGNLQNCSHPTQHYSLVESTITRLNLFFNAAVNEAIFSEVGKGVQIDDILNRKKCLLVCDFGTTDEFTVDQSRILQKILLEAMTRSVMSRTEQEGKARPFSVFIDEASSSGLLDLANAEALQATRKFGLHTAYIVQGIAGVENRQPGVKMMDGLIENVCGKLVFGTASDVDAQRFARLAVGGMDFKQVKFLRETERQKIVDYRVVNRVTTSTSPEGKHSTAVTPIEKPITVTETEQVPMFFSPEELFHMKAGELLALETGQFYYFGPEFPSGILLKIPSPKVVTAVSKRLTLRKRESFKSEILTQFPYRDIDGILRSFQKMLKRYQLPEQTKSLLDTDQGPFV